MSVPGAAPPGFGEVFDRGYRQYDGPRLGRRHAFQALTTYSMKRALGARKRWTAKVIPVLMYLAAALVVIIPLGIRAFLPDAGVLEYWDYFSVSFLILGVFIAAIAPELLCPDRRENVLILYFSRALTRLDYLLAKLLAAVILTLTITLVPVVVYWLGRQLLDDDPLSALVNNLGDLVRVAVAAVMISFYLGSVALAVSSFTGRKSIAVGVIIVLFIVTNALAALIAIAANDSEISRYMSLLSPNDTVSQFAAGLFDEQYSGEPFGEALPVWLYGLVMAAVTAVSCGIMYWRYVPSD